MGGLEKYRLTIPERASEGEYTPYRGGWENILVGQTGAGELGYTLRLPVPYPGNSIHTIDTLDKNMSTIYI